MYMVYIKNVHIEFFDSSVEAQDSDTVFILHIQLQASLKRTASESEFPSPAR